MDAIDKLLLICIAISIVILLIADIVVLSVSPIKTSWKKGEVMEIYEKGRLKKYRIASKFLNWSLIFIGVLIVIILGRIVFAQLLKDIWAFFGPEEIVGTVTMVSVFGILFSTLSLGISLFKIYLNTDIDIEVDQDNNTVLIPPDRPNSNLTKSFRGAVISSLFFIVFFVLFIVACNLGI